MTVKNSIPNTHYHIYRFDMNRMHEKKACRKKAGLRSFDDLYTFRLQWNITADRKAVPFRSIALGQINPVRGFCSPDPSAIEIRSKTIERFGQPPAGQFHIALSGGPIAAEEKKSG